MVSTRNCLQIGWGTLSPCAGREYVTMHAVGLRFMTEPGLKATTSSTTRLKALMVGEGKIRTCGVRGKSMCIEYPMSSGMPT